MVAQTDSTARGRQIGRAIDRVEDAALLTGRGRYADDLGVRPGTLHAAFLRSPHGHAEILRIDCRAALELEGVEAVLTGEDVRKWAAPFVVGVKQPMEHWCLAVERVRYVGEPVAVVVARDRYLAEDALDLINVDYRPLSPVIDPEAAAGEGAPLLHPAVGSNVVSDRSFRYGDPDSAFAEAPRRVGVTVRYPRNSVTPIECYVVVADYEPAEGAYEVLSNFQGPFALHPVMALALKVPGNRLRLRTPPDSGGSFGTKQGVFPAIVALSLAARKAGRPVKWVEDRLEHLSAATSATNRRISLEAAVAQDGRILALRYDQLEDCGAYLRAPEPATLYRMHGNLNGAYGMRHLAVRNRIVVTNKTPTGLVRGFGGPQMYFALERLMQRIAVELALDPLDVIRRNLVAADAFPYRTPSGGLLDSGNYQAAIDLAVTRGGLDDLKVRRDAARAEGRLYGIGMVAVVEPSVSNMGYITTVLTAEERRKAGLKGGAMATATVAIDPLGSVSVHVASCHQGQGHRTVLAQVVADVFGLKPGDIRCNLELDTGKDAWSVASGNYSSRFGPAVAGTAHMAALKLRGKLLPIAAHLLGCREDEVSFAEGKVSSSATGKSLPFHRVAATSHWSQGTLPADMPAALRETVFWSSPTLTPPSDNDEINSSGAYGFIFDFCGVEVDRDTGRVRIDRYVTMHDAGTILNPALVDGQVRGSFANAVGAALFEHFAYGADGSFQSGSFADYVVPTACEVPEPIILHMSTPSPFTPLGAKGVGEGNCMSTPVCIANAVADALGVAEVELPLTPSRVAALMHPSERPPRMAPAGAGPARAAPAAGGRDHALTGHGETRVPATPEEVWRIILDPARLAAVIPGCRELLQDGENSYRASLSMGVGPIRGVFEARVRLSDLDPARSLRIAGGASGPLGSSEGEGQVWLEPDPQGTVVRYQYGLDLSGKVAAVGGRMLDGAARALIGQFFEHLVAQAGGAPARRRPWWRRLLALLGVAE